MTNGKGRLIIALSHPSLWLIVLTFQMIRVSDVLEMVRPSDFLASLGLESAHLHVPVAPESRNDLQFRVDDAGYSFIALPFGLATARPF